MCRERGSVLFNQRKTLNNITPQHEPERLILKANKPQYTHLLSADDETILSEIIEKLCSIISFLLETDLNFDISGSQQNQSCLTYTIVQRIAI